MVGGARSQLHLHCWPAPGDILLHPHLLPQRCHFLGTGLEGAGERYRWLWGELAGRQNQGEGGEAGAESRMAVGPRTPDEGTGGCVESRAKMLREESRCQRGHSPPGESAGLSATPGKTPPLPLAGSGASARCLIPASFRWLPRKL